MRRYPAEFLANIPARLAPIGPPPTADEITRCLDIRRPFLFEGEGDPFVEDIVRAFRLLKGLKTYIEIGTYDKGNLAYISTLLADDATLVDVDIQANEGHAGRLGRAARPSQKVHTVVGDSAADTTVRKVIDALGERQADAVFIDGNHCAMYVFDDYAAYSRLVKPGGLVFFHDVYWTGDGTVQGAVPAMQLIDRHTPVHVVMGKDEPIHRYMPPFDGRAWWGCVGVLVKP